MRLRGHLTLLTIGTLLPVALIGMFAAWHFVEHDQQAFQRSTLERMLTLRTAADAEIAGTIATASALGEALDVNAGEYLAFREVAQRILATQPDWSNINLALPSGQQVVNLARPQGSPLHSIAGVDGSLERILRDREPVVNDLGFGTATQTWDIAVRVPIIREREVKYILTAVVRPESLGALLEAQRVPAEWGAIVMDGRGKVIARVPGRAVAGEPASESMQRTLAGPASGWVRGATREGEQVYIAYERSPLTGWTVAIRVPVSVVHGIAARAAWIGALLVLAALALAAALATFMSRRIAQPVVSLADAAAAIGRGERREVPVGSGVREVAALGRALQLSSAAIAERQALLERERETLRSMDRSKNEFIAMLSHELRNPLAPILIGADLLRHQSDPARVSETAAMIKRQAGQITRLIEDLLDISGIVMGKVTLDRARLDLAEVAREVTGTWRAAGKFERHRLELELQPAWVDADRSRMEQIVSNLLANSVKFTPPNGRISVATRAQDGHAVLEVSDTGKGLPPELIAVVFDPFVQGKQNLARAEGGLGIGLALVKQLVGLHGGTVEMQSDGPGRGAKVSMTLPRAAAPVSHAPRGDHTAPANRALSILVVEDNDDTRRALRDALKAEGHQLHEAADGLAAIDTAEKRHVDLALVDIGLPKADGYEVARALRRRFNGEIVLVALTGYGQREDRERALREGFDEHVVKPVTQERLSKILRSAASRPG